MEAIAGGRYRTQEAAGWQTGFASARFPQIAYRRGSHRTSLFTEVAMKHSSCAW